MKNEILADFDFATDSRQFDLDCFVFECNDTMLGLAISWLLHTNTQSVQKLSYNTAMKFLALN